MTTKGIKSQRELEARKLDVRKRFADRKQGRLRLSRLIHQTVSACGGDRQMLVAMLCESIEVSLDYHQAMIESIREALVVLRRWQNGQVGNAELIDAYRSIIDDSEVSMSARGALSLATQGLTWADLYGEEANEDDHHPVAAKPEYVDLEACAALGGLMEQSSSYEPYDRLTAVELEQLLTKYRTRAKRLAGKRPRRLRAA